LSIHPTWLNFLKKILRKYKVNSVLKLTCRQVQLRKYQLLCLFKNLCSWIFFLEILLFVLLKYWASLIPATMMRSWTTNLSQVLKLSLDEIFKFGNKIDDWKFNKCLLTLTISWNCTLHDNILISDSGNQAT
jgi:hypothetical protein